MCDGKYRMKRNSKGDREKEAKKKKLLQQIGNARLPFVTPQDEKCHDLWKTSYANLDVCAAQETPAELHQHVQKAFLTLLRNGCLFQDLVQLKGKNILTPVSRILIGQPGYTYRYLNTRLFAVPWPDRNYNITYSTQELADACKAFYDLNTFLYEQTKLKLHRCAATREFSNISPHQRLLEKDCQVKEDDLESFNVTLINYMNPQAMSYLREEPYFGMGRMAVSWHHDENLVAESTVAVYSYSYQDNTTEIGEDEMSKWHVGLKIAWDIETPGLAVPLNPGDTYFLLDNLNQTHQHCVIAGSQPRFSSTHRLVESCKGTLNYILSRCQSAVENLCAIPNNGGTKLKSLELDILKQAEEVHNEVEFEWLRQFWFQGNRYTKCSDFWIKAMEDLEVQWRHMETMTSHLLEGLGKDTWTQNDKCKIVKSIFPLLQERHDLRQEWRERLTKKPCIHQVHPSIKYRKINPQGQILSH
ncbi:alpha-ketoglutarate-dependent dioxygenase FTO isoform X2 [Hyperolius riggenbachi]|uniref:alpha-ketoglutarate-dependent dioxygenase FTO isoform X2 n=1 Tax=Hyperolius riggenbachi TaxID=752182 RepID=UPI0035A395EF